MIAITGATGYIGYQLVSLLLKQNKEILLLTRNKPSRINMALPELMGQINKL